MPLIRDHLFGFGTFKNLMQVLPLISCEGFLAVCPLDELATADGIGFLDKDKSMQKGMCSVKFLQNILSPFSHTLTLCVFLSFWCVCLFVYVSVCASLSLLLSLS